VSVNGEMQLVLHGGEKGAGGRRILVVIHADGVTSGWRIKKTLALLHLRASRGIGENL
jgi:hypothetical protein